MEQSLNDWVQEYLAAGINPEWMCVCSDKSAGNVEIDDFDIDLQDLGIPVTTNKDEIRNFLSKRSKHHKIIFTTYQSGHLLKQVCKNQKIKFDLAIFDEAHKTVGVADKSFAALLHEKNIHIKHRVFMTATERKIVHRREDEVVSMDDTKIYGNIFYQLSFRKAIDNGIISDYKIVTLTVTNSQVENLIENNSLLNIKGSGLNSTESIYVATGIAVKKAMKKYKINHAISFHRSIPLAKNFRGLLDTFNKEKTLRPVSKNYHVSSKQKTGERAQMLKDFASQKPSLITNARCLTEGVDIPAVDCILFADPKQSLVDIVQATGRAMRPAPGKKFGYVILPLVVPDNYEVDDFAEETAFRHITKVISVLSTHDERISEEFRLIRAGTISKGKIINIDSALPIGHKIKLDKFAESINARVWDKVAKVNFRNFDEARNYARRLQLDNWREWLALENLPPDIPREPKKVYKLDWISVSDWLGTPYISTSKRKYRNFIGARKYVQSLKLAGQKQYYELAREKKLPIDIPQSPNNTYKDKGWVSWGDWLGTGRVATNKIQFLKFIEARAYVRTLKLKGKTDWYQFIQSKKFPKFLPTNPQRTYKKKGWISWGDWFGTKTVSVKNRSMIFLDFKKSRNFSRSLNLLSAKEWRKFVLRKDFPSNIPKDPYGYYKDKGWVSWGDWLGTGRAHKKFLSFVEARAYARSLGFKKMIQWRNFAKSSLRPKNIPSNPWEVYSDSYISIKDWLEEP